jgi:hypothetical protein
MKNNNFSSDSRETPKLEPLIEIPTKDEVNGKRKQKRKDKDYDRKYGDREDRWN